ncbi:hypothetical protein ACNAW0_11615 [Micromonospora sp. SL1-18]|uniref:hypothetical protein n=1 Tax=Micromonospora sp. SL1-18 TaxID=3399128 RepID=UPI003A4DC5A0
MVVPGPDEGGTAVWRFKQQRQGRIDQTGAATVYPHRGGAYASCEAAADRPAWDGPTIIPSISPLLTLGQIRRASDVKSRGTR